MPTLKITVSIVISTISLIATPSEARRSGSLCNGIDRCRCGSTQARYFGLPRMVNGHNLWQAREWARAFPHTTAHAGAVMYQHGGGPTGHVSRIVSVNGTCTATVADERGQYERNICIRGAVFVDPNGNSVAFAQAPAKREQIFAARSHRHKVARNQTIGLRLEGQMHVTRWNAI